MLALTLAESCLCFSAPSIGGADAEAGRVKSMWTDIMGFTVDVMPFVGRLDSSITGRKIPKRQSSINRGDQLQAAPGE